MSLQDAIDRFALGLPLLNTPGDDAAQYRDDAQAIVDAARRVANPDIEAATSVLWGIHGEPFDAADIARQTVNAAFGITEDSDAD